MLAHDFLKKDDRTFTPTSSRSAWYFLVLVLTKLCRCVGIFFIDVLAKQIHVIGLLWLLKLLYFPDFVHYFIQVSSSSFVLLPVQKPFTNGRSIRKALHFRIAQLAVFNSILESLWLYGVTFCGPLRSILVFEQSSTVILVALVSVIRGSGSSAKSRGVFCLISGFLILFIMDSDATIETNHTEAHSHQSGLNHVFYHIVSWFGISDHNGGVLLLTVVLLLRISYDSNFRQLAVEIGGPKRLYAIVSTLSAVFLTPLAVLILALGSSFINSTLEFFSFLILAVVFVMLIDFYSESICFQHVADPVMAIARWSPIVMFTTSLFISWFWYESPSYLPSDKLTDQPDFHQNQPQHAISAGVVIATLFFLYSSFILTSQKTSRSVGGHFIGISEDGVPLYTHGEAFLHKTSRSILRFCRETLHEILNESDSRRIFWFLCANLAFCGIEFVYGFWTNSLGLISDGFHMLFDCSALVMGLVASVMARWTASRFYSYGYGRIEVLSGFVNALFLIVIAFFIFMEALERLYDPPNIQTDKLMFVAVTGLLVNLFGMYAFHGASHGHSHGGGGGDHHCHSHGASNEHSTHSHGHSHGGNANMQGVFLHVLADTLGSVFVIISTLMIQWFGWQWVDPLCSLILSILIVGSVCPLLKSSASVLLQSVPDDADKLDQIGEEILKVDGVIGHNSFHLWQLKSGINVASVHVEIAGDTNEQIVRQRVIAILRQYGSTQSTVQVDKSGGLAHASKSEHKHDQALLRNGSVGLNIGA